MAESGILDQVASDGAIKEPEIFAVPASNGATTESRMSDQASSSGTAMESETNLKVQVSAKSPSQDPSSTDQAASDGATKEPEIFAVPASNGTTTESRMSDQASSSGTAMESEANLKVQVSAKSLSQDPSSTGWLDLSRRAFAEKKTRIDAMLLGENLFPNLKVLFLEGNAGDLGIRVTLKALRAGHLKRLEKLILWEVSSYNKITRYEAGTHMIADALKDANLPILNTMDLTGSLPKLIPARSKSKAITELLFGCSMVDGKCRARRESKPIRELLFGCSRGNGRFLEGCHICMGCLIPFGTDDPNKNQALECLRCLVWKLEVYSGDDGMIKIAEALFETPIDSLKSLILQQNYIGDRGASELAEILELNKLPNLDELDLRNNPVGYEGAKKIAFSYLKNPLLTLTVKLDWPNAHLERIAVAFRDSNTKLEFRLKKLKLCGKDIVIGEYIDLLHYWSTGPEFRLHLECQAHCERYGKEQKLKPHHVEEGGLGIRVTTRKLEGNSSQTIVQRDPGQDASELKPANDLKDRAIDKFYLSTSKRHLAQAKISRGVRAVCLRPAKPPKLKRDSIDELLMLAESNPKEFYAMFGLRQVLLRNPPGQYEGMYSRVWVCTPCFLIYSKPITTDAVQPITTDAVRPITTDAEVEPSVGNELLASRTRHWTKHAERHKQRSIQARAKMVAPPKGSPKQMMGQPRRSDADGDGVIK